jgi:CPA1 family monovalent cation:H+ antiporter
LLLLAGKTSDPMIEITFTTVAAYGSFLLAEHFHFSGVLAVLTAGLMVGNLGPLGSISERGRTAVVSFWDYAAFVVNSLIFILIGLGEAHQDFLTVLGASAAAVVLVTAGRALAIYPLAALFARSTRLRVPLREQHVLFWGGLRGALALALALGLPASLPHRDEIVTVAFAVVAFSIVVQGMTMQPLLRRLGHLDNKAADDNGPTKDG